VWIFVDFFVRAGFLPENFREYTQIYTKYRCAAVFAEKNFIGVITDKSTS